MEKEMDRGRGKKKRERKENLVIYNFKSLRLRSKLNKY